MKVAAAVPMVLNNQPSIWVIGADLWKYDFFTNCWVIYAKPPVLMEPGPGSNVTLSMIQSCVSNLMEQEKYKIRKEIENEVREEIRREMLNKRL